MVRTVHLVAFGKQLECWINRTHSLFMFAMILEIANSTPKVRFGHCKNDCSIKSGLEIIKKLFFIVHKVNTLTFHYTKTHSSHGKNGRNVRRKKTECILHTDFLTLCSFWTADHLSPGSNSCINVLQSTHHNIQRKCSV